ncbi:MAG: NADH-quinone oxidoreductase subunit H [candidate division FCPU426 bacterium]
MDAKLGLSGLAWGAALLLAPLWLGLINRVKAFFGGRQGMPLLQAYYDLAKLWGKRTVYSRTTSWVLRAATAWSLAAVLLASTFVPWAGQRALAAFPGDAVLMLYLLALARFGLVLGALDTGSAFAGLGASREAWLSALAEPVLFLGLAVLALRQGQWSLSGLLGGAAGWPDVAVCLVALAWAVVLAVENARLPVDDPNTHLELTMIHEAMILDVAGPDLALVVAGSAVKFSVFSALLVGLFVPVDRGPAWLWIAASLAGMAAVAVAVGLVESTMARWRLPSLPRLLAGAGALTVIALVWVLR